MTGFKCDVAKIGYKINYIVVEYMTKCDMLGEWVV